MRRRTAIPLLVVLAVLAALGVALYLRAKAPPEAARLLPESDAIVFLHLKTLRSATHFDSTPVARGSDFQRFIDATGIEPERDIDSAAFALHSMPNPIGPNGPIAYSEVFVGRFDGTRLADYLAGIATDQETYAGRKIYSIPIEGRTLRITQLGYDTVAASNMPTVEQIHSMIDRARASALGTPGSSLLAARFHEVPLLSQAWGIGHIGLPFAQNGALSLMGMELPMSPDTDLVASLRYNGALHLRIEEIGSDDAAAEHTVDTLTTLLNILRGVATAAPPRDPADAAMRSVLGSVVLEAHKERAVLSATASIDEVKALASAKAPAADATAPPGATTPAATPAPATPSKH